MRTPRTPSRLGLFVLLCLMACWVQVAGAAPKRTTKFHVTMGDVSTTAAPEDLRATLAPKLTAELQKQLAAHPKLAALVAPPPESASSVVWEKYLKKQKVKGAYRLVTKLTSAAQREEPDPDRPGKLRLVVELEVQLFGEIIPGRGLGFTGTGSSTIKQDIGRKVRPSDQAYAWDGAIEAAITEAIAECVTKLEAGPAKVAPPAKKR